MPDSLAVRTSRRLVRRLAHAIAALGLALVAGCSGHGKTLDPAVIGDPALTPTALPAPVTVDKVASWTNVTSSHGVGYTFPVKNATGVRAQWTEPTVKGAPGEEEFVWIGVGGWDYTVQNIAQVGTFGYLPKSGGLNQGVWYQFVPVLQKAQFPSIDVKPGDRIFAYVVELDAGKHLWQVFLQDLTTGKEFDKTMEFNSLHGYPTIVVEDPNVGELGPSSPFLAFPQWSDVTFSNIEIRVDGRWLPAATMHGYRIQMLQNGDTLANASALNSGSGFTATRA
jgi:peptidase A4-like protein